jgi:hypothetical protein
MHLYLDDARIRLLTNLLVAGDAVMTTLTGPGEAYLPWDRSSCRHPPGMPCSGRHGCIALAAHAARWNASALRRWSRLHKAASQAVYRECGPGALKRWAYVPELQRRGVVHWHVVLGFATPLQRRAARRYVAHLNRLAWRYGYGYTDRKPLGSRSVGERSIVAYAYLAKYLTKGTTGGVADMLERGQCPERAVFVHPELTAKTRCTARNLRRRRALFMAGWGQLADCREVESVWALCSAFDVVQVGDVGVPAAPAHGPPVAL